MRWSKMTKDEADAMVMRKGGSRVYNNHLDDQTHAALFTIVTVHRYQELVTNHYYCLGYPSRAVYN